MVLALTTVMGLGRSASAQVNVAIDVAPPDAEAPATLTLTASVTAPDPIADYAWSGLDGAPPCHTRQCPVPIGMPSCRTVHLEATTLLDERGVGTQQVCARDQGQHPPNARLRVRADGDGGFIAAPEAIAGTARLAWTLIYVDDQPPVRDAPVSIPGDEACHAVDLLVIDEAGRYGLEQTVVCGSAQAPRIALGAEADPCPPLGESLRICSRGTHPLGLPLTISGGEAELEACTAEIPAPTELTRHWAQAQDAEGRTANGSFFACGRPTQGGALFFLDLAADYTVEAQKPLDLRPTTPGGQAPYFGEARLINEGGTIARINLARSTNVILPQAPRQPGLYRLELDLTDDRGLTAHAQSFLTVTPRVVQPQADGGPRPDSGMSAPSALSQGAGCQALGGAQAGSFGLLLFGAWALARRRR